MIKGKPITSADLFDKKTFSSTQKQLDKILSTCLKIEASMARIKKFKK